MGTACFDGMRSGSEVTCSDSGPDSENRASVISSPYHCVSHLIQPPWTATLVTLRLTESQTLKLCSCFNFIYRDMKILPLLDQPGTNRGNIRGKLNRVDVVSNESQTRWDQSSLDDCIHLAGPTMQFIQSLILRLRSMLLGRPRTNFPMFSLVSGPSLD